jgi:hypothetical protein
MRREIFCLSALAVSAIVPSSAIAREAHHPVAVGVISSKVPTLWSAAAIGTLIRIDPSSHFAEFHVSCGRYVPTMRQVGPGFWKVNLRRATFGWETSPTNMSEGSVQSVSLIRWATWARQEGWKGSLRLYGRGAWLSNGPTTDICAGVLG